MARTNHLPWWCGDAAQKCPNQFVPAHPAEHQPEGSRPHQDDEDHAGQLHGGMHNFLQNFRG